MRDELHAEDVLGARVGVLERLHELDAAALAAATGVDLRLDHDRRIACAEQRLGGGVGLFERGCHLARRHGNAVLPQDLFCLVLVNLHRRGTAFSHAQSRTEKPARQSHPSGCVRRPANDARPRRAVIGHCPDRFIRLQFRRGQPSGGES